MVKNDDPGQKCTFAGEAVTYAKLNNSKSSGISTVVTLPLILQLTNNPTYKLELSTKGSFFPAVVLGPFP